MNDLVEMPTDLTFRQEWQRVVFGPDGERWPNLDSGWWDDFSVARHLLNEEYPEPSSTGFRFMLETRWVSEHRPVAAQQTGDPR